MPLVRRLRKGTGQDAQRNIDGRDFLGSIRSCCVFSARVREARTEAQTETIRGAPNGEYVDARMGSRQRYLAILPGGGFDVGC